jgi:DNA modification methylase
MTNTTTFGVGKRESHRADTFYNRRLFQGLAVQPEHETPESVAIPDPSGWTDRIYRGSSAHRAAIPDNGVALAFTSPPYNVGKAYDKDLDLPTYLKLIQDVAREVYRALRLRDVHEYLLVFAKRGYSRPERGESDISRDEFMAATLSIWQIPPTSAKQVGHPAPFPVALTKRVIRLYSYVGDVVLDPFAGSGTTCLAAHNARRRYVGYDTSRKYCRPARLRLAQPLRRWFEPTDACA